MVAIHPIDTRSVREALDAGQSLPAEWYTTTEYLDRERKEIFARSWQYAGHVDQIPEPGDFFTFQAGHLPLVVVRDTEGGIKAFVNVCRHRGHAVVLGQCGNQKAFQCHYHAWTYRLNGELVAAPRSDREPGFDKSSLSMISLQVDTWGPLIFVNPDLNSPPLAATLGDLPSLLESWGYDLWNYQFRKEMHLEVPSNWKVYIENAIECYHCPTAHPSFSARVDVDPDTYELRASGHLISHISRLKLERNGRREPAQPVPDSRPGYNFFYIWPNIMLEINENMFNIRRIYPQDPHRTDRIAHTYFDRSLAEAEILEVEAEMAADPTLGEDMVLVERVQNALRSGMLPHAQLLMDSEFLLHHVQELVYRTLNGEPTLDLETPRSGQSYLVAD
jgi:phenylpropionate dioxygenase-like ring-hydroxylating dioxygenase large terminal subunit